MVHNNPAARVYCLVSKLRSTSPNGPPARLWAQALDIPLNQEMAGPPFVQVVQGILSFSDLLSETETGLHELGFDDFYQEAFPPLRLLVQRSLSNLRANQSNLTRPITDETLTLLRVLASEWENKKPDPKIDDETLKEIQTKALDLFETVKRAEIDWRLKHFILSSTLEIEQAIQQYRIGGGEHTKSLWTRFYKVAGRLFELVKFAGDTRKTIEAVRPFIRLLGGR